MDWEVILRENQGVFPMSKLTFQPEEVALAYTIYNLKFGTAKRDTGCGACRREVITAIKKAVLKL